MIVELVTFKAPAGADWDDPLRRARHDPALEREPASSCASTIC